MNCRLTFFCHSILLKTSNPLQISKPTNPRANGFTLFRAFMYTSPRYTNNTNFRRVNATIDPNDPSTLIKEDGVSVCSKLWIESFRNPNQTVSNLANYLRRFELWVLAYQKVYADEMGAYMPKSSIQRSALEDLIALRNIVLDNRFRWGPRLEFFTKSPKDKTEYESLSKRKIRAILTTTQPSPFQDRIVKEVLFMVLEPVNEGRFSEKSYAFRPGRTAHTALRVIRRSQERNR